jgi:hypothetical protein
MIDGPRLRGGRYLPIRSIFTEHPSYWEFLCIEVGMPDGDFKGAQSVAGHL